MSSCLGILAAYQEKRQTGLIGLVKRHCQKKNADAVIPLFFKPTDDRRFTFTGKGRVYKYVDVYFLETLWKTGSHNRGTENTEMSFFFVCRETTANEKNRC